VLTDSDVNYTNLIKILHNLYVPNSRHFWT
jgi:hypothetical protein